MKKVMTLLLLFIVVASANAQRTKTSSITATNGFYVGGGVTFESTSDETAIAIVPEIGYKMSNKASLGARVGFGSQGSGDSKYTIFSIKPYVRQNLMALGQIKFILDYQLLYQSDGLKDNKTNTFGLGIAPGLFYQLNNRLSVATHLGFVGYTSSKLDVEGAEAVNKFSLNASSENLGLSLFYNF